MAGTTNTHKKENDMKVPYYKNETLADMLLDVEAAKATIHEQTKNLHAIRHELKLALAQVENAMLVDNEAIALENSELHWHQGDPHDVVDALDM